MKESIMENHIHVLQPVQPLIGMRYAPSVKPYILELTQLSIAVGPGDVSTKDLRTDRVFISVDDKGVISKLHIA
jgi:hypothetical protein